MRQDINLYEERLRPKISLATGRNFGIAVLVVCGLMTVLSVWVQFDARQKDQAAAISQKQLAGEQEKLTALTQLMAKRKISPALAEELENTKTMLGVRSEVMAVLESGKLGNSTGFSAFMSGFARQAQSDLWLTGFRVTTGGDEIEIRGRLLDAIRLPAYVQRLSSEPVFKGRRFATLEMQGVDPEAQNAGQPATQKTGDKGNTSLSEERLPRFVEFVLRSENIAPPEKVTPGGVNP
ncbi:MAG: hypothetical protein WCL27_14915 [Betaproteobacteria bacterium]